VTRALYFTVLNAAESSRSFLKVIEETERLRRKERRKEATVLGNYYRKQASKKRIVAIDIPTRNYSGLANAQRIRSFTGSCFRMKELC